MDIFSRKLGVLAIALFFFNAGAAFAGVFTIGSQLTGDPRIENPDNIFLDLTIDVEDMVSTWVIAIDSPLHPYSHLKNFFFNLDTVATGAITFSDFSPSDWTVSSGNNVQGSGSADFDFEAGSGQTSILSFKATLAINWTEDMFFGAHSSTSSDVALGTFQVGAHVGALTLIPADTTVTTNSGFATGNYNAVPLPSAVFLFGTGLAGLFGLRIRRKK